ncbi:hypothetical protein BZA77DRAFT_262352 [Pyronema omphalodes]|nr:hypothetical protein BZA77DRAFT_262352 [Pyronema omphalodes]
MCGRYVLFLKLSQVHQRLLDAGLRVDSTVPDNETRPSYNISPSSFEPVYYATPGDGTKEQKYRLEPMKWGLTVPNTHITAINLRTESLTAKPPSWKSHLRSHRRCIIPANGFYEWLSSGSTKIPYYTKLAVGEVLTSSDQTSSTQTPQAPTRTFTILTTTSNPHLQFLHDRMPVILTASQVPLWLDTNKSWSPELEALLKPYEGELVTYQVTQEVGKVGNSEPGFIVPVKERKDGIMEAFKKQAVGGKKSEVEKKGGEGKEEEEDAVKEVESQKFIPTLKSVSTAMEGFVSNSPTKVKDKSKTGEKRSAEDAGNEEKKVRRLPHRRTRRMKSAISNADQRRVKQTKNDGNVKITNFFESK